VKKVLCIVFVIALAAIAIPAGAAVLVCAADTQVARLGDYMNGTTNVVDHGVCEWQVGSNTTYTNVQSVSILGLFAATVATGDPVYALAAFATVNLQISRYAANPLLVPYSQDIEALVEACRFDPAAYGLTASDMDSRYAGVVEGNEGYCVVASNLYFRVMGQYSSAALNADHYIDQRLSLAGWDASASIDAAWRAGYGTYAADMLQRLLDRRPSWEGIPYNGYDYTQLSHAAMLRVMIEMYRVGLVGEATYDEAVAIGGNLIANQEVGGSWAESDPQATAYALLGLRADPFIASVGWQQSALRAKNFLEATATTGSTCGWSYPPEIGEVNSEAIWALASIGSLPFIDGFESEDTSAWSSSVETFGALPPIKSLSQTARPPALPTL
jgi:hypothetical protein